MCQQTANKRFSTIVLQMFLLVILGGQEELVKTTSTGMAISTAPTKAVLVHWMAAVTQV